MTWIIKWNRNDSDLSIEHDWKVALERATQFSCFGVADGEGGSRLESVHDGDLALGYQTDDKKFYGVVQVIPRQSQKHRPSIEVIPVTIFAKPLHRNALQWEKQLKDVDALKPGAVHSIREVAREHFDAIVKLANSHPENTA